MRDSVVETLAALWAGCLGRAGGFPTGAFLMRIDYDIWIISESLDDPLPWVLLPLIWLRLPDRPAGVWRDVMNAFPAGEAGGFEKPSCEIRR